MSARVPECGSTEAACPGVARSAAIKGESARDHDRPRLGFLGVGWIGRHRMEAIARSGHAHVVAIADPSAECLAVAAESVPHAEPLSELDPLLERELDGVVIATPSALHAQQAIRALDRDLAVFCQKPLGRSAEETRGVVEAARRADRLLGVDFSYRHTAALERLRELVAAGELGRVFAADLVFHNAYGPDKPWFYDPRQSGGGCVMDLGIHLVDSLLWLLDFPRVEQVESRLFSRGLPFTRESGQVEDYAIATLGLANGTAARLACSWNLPAGAEAEIGITLYGTAGGARFRNVNGSFYDFVLEQLDGTYTRTLVEPPDDWGGRAAVEWARRLAEGARFDPDAEQAVRVAEVLDRIYGNAECGMRNAEVS